MTSGENRSAEWKAWSRQGLWWSEAARGRPLLWPAGESWFVNDPLGPMPHTHPGASEYYFLASGVMNVTVGRTEFTMATEDLCLIPPDTYHHPHNGSDRDVALLAFVAPNLRDQRWKYQDFDERDFEGTPVLSNVRTAGPLPGDGNLSATLLHLAGGSAAESLEDSAGECLVYVLDGSVEASVGPLSGTLGGHGLLACAGTVRRSFRAIEDASVLVITPASTR